jgi:hypothetical protein
MFLNVRRKKLAVRRADFKDLARKDIQLDAELRRLTKDDLQYLLSKGRYVQVEDRYKLEFELRESSRDKSKDNQPRSKSIYLASIREDDLKNQRALNMFWEKVKYRISKCRLSEENKKQILAKIEWKVSNER